MMFAHGTPFMVCANGRPIFFMHSLSESLNKSPNFGCVVEIHWSGDLLDQRDNAEPPTGN